MSRVRRHPIAACASVSVHFAAATATFDSQRRPGRCTWAPGVQALGDSFTAVTLNGAWHGGGSEVDAGQGVLGGGGEEVYIFSEFRACKFSFPVKWLEVRTDDVQRNLQHGRVARSLVRCLDTRARSLTNDLLMALGRRMANA